jgi:hypothetical protein
MRKCKVYKNEYYFIGWTQKAYIQKHPQNPQYDKVYTPTKGIIECCNTHAVELCDPEEIQFLDSPTLL